MYLIRKLMRMKQRSRRAARLGFEFKRAAGFRPPSKLKIQGQTLNLSCPNEVSAINHFFSAFLDDEYRLELHKWNVSTVLDFGSNFGFFSLAARNNFGNARIHAYESDMTFAKYLRHHAIQASFDVHFEAIDIDRENLNASLLEDTAQTRDNSKSSVVAPPVSFNKAVERLGSRVDFAKIDCGGLEWKLLDDQDPWQRVNFLAMKYNIKFVQKNHYDVHLALRKLGFQILRLKPFDDCGIVFAMRL